MYGQDSDKRYPGMQAEFFERAGDVLKRREALRGFVALGEWQGWDGQNSSAKGSRMGRAPLEAAQQPGS
jgi:hypothetical protein